MAEPWLPAAHRQPLILLPQNPIDEELLRRIYHPTYLSLETALPYHGLISEGVHTLTSVNPLKTQQSHSQ